MKFLCEQCKAKYQIGDDKVAGKTVRMKCRKCGHLIEVRAAVTETSVAAAPREPDLSKRALLAAPPPVSRPIAGRTPALGSSLGASVSASSKLRPRTEHPAAVAGALEGAFRSSVQHPREDEVSAPFDMAELSANDEWYVAINGVPVGPIRIAEVRRKAALGAVTEDSLCWQEGLDEWRPLRAFPELAATVREAMTSSRLSRPPSPDGRSSSLPPPPPARSVPPRQPAPLAPPPPRAGLSRAAAAVATPPPQARSNVVPLLSKLATAEKLDELPGRMSPVPGAPLALPPPAAIPLLPVASDPFPAATAIEPMAPAPAASTASALASAPPSRGRKSTPWMALMMVALAGAFGVTAALVLLLRPPSAPTPPAPSAESTPSGAAATLSASSAALPPPPSTAAAEPAAAPLAAVATAAPKPKPAAKPASATAAPAGAPSAGDSLGSPPGRTLDLHGLAQNAPTISPTDDPGLDPAAKAAGQCLSEGAIQQVLLTHKPGLTRGCWERNPSNKMSVSVNVSMTIGPDGRPQSVSASGDDPSVAKCIENDVRGWHFPAAGCSQATQIPFKFVKQ